MSAGAELVLSCSRVPHSFWLWGVGSGRHWHHQHWAAMPYHRLHLPTQVDHSCHSWHRLRRNCTIWADRCWGKHAFLWKGQILAWITIVTKSGHLLPCKQGKDPLQLFFFGGGSTLISLFIRIWQTIFSNEVELELRKPLKDGFKL